VGVLQGCPPPPRPPLWLRPDTAPKDVQTQRNGQLFTEVPRIGILGTSCLRSSKKFVPLTVRRELRGLPETLAEIFYPFLGSIARHAYLRLFDALFAVGAVPQFLELLAGLCVQNGLHRFFDGLTTPVRPDLRLAQQDLVGHLPDASIFAHGAPLLAETFPQGEYNLARFLGAKRTVLRTSP
jgi:hypothetical protein